MAGQMNPRLLWMIQCMADTFGKEEYKIEDWARRKENYQAISNFLKGLGSPKILIYRQSHEATPGQEDYQDPSDDIGLFIHSGEVSKIRTKGVFFYRTVAEGKAVNTQSANDMEVMYGEIGANPISSLDTIISSVYVPLVNAMEDTEWGECDKEQRSELVTGLNKFASDLSEAIKSMSGEIKLRSPDRDYEIENTPEKIREASENQDFVNHYAFLLQNWIDTINNYIDENPKGRVDPNEPGPHTELEFWRARNQRLTSINEQTRTKEVKTVLAVLHMANKSSIEHNAKSDTTTLITNWKNVDIKITEALNEAKDNVKYLTTLEKFIEPLYSGTPQTIIDSLPALMNSVKMIHTIARYYNTVEKMTQLFTKITNQMITTCKKTILQGKSVDKLWLRDPDELIETMQSCIKLKDAYQTQYDSTKEKLQAMPKGKQFDFSKNQIFGKFDLFCRRMTKLIELFTIVRQFRSLAKHKLEDMDGLLAKFNEAIVEFQGERHDLLDYSNNYFDRRYVKFNVNVSGLEEELQNYINKCFEKNVSIDKSLRLLKKFETILKRGSLQAELNNKYNIIFSNYGNEMTQIKNEYNSCKANPPLQRNMPTVAGNIKWARHLFHRIKDPMDKFPEGIKKTRDKDHKSHITLYNRIGQTLTLFEFMYLRAWCGEIEKSKTGLHALLLWPNEEKKLHVNLDDEIFQLIREAKCLDRMGVEIPESARIVLLQEEKIKHYYNELDYLLKEYERVLGKIRPITKPLLAPHLEDLEYKLRPGIVTLTWTSMNIDGYLHHVHSGLQKLEQLIISINDIIENRIENNLKAISKVILVEMPENGKTYTQDEFVDLQHNSANTQTAFLKSKNIEVERAVDDLLQTIRSYPLDQHVEGVNKEEVHKLKKYYNWTMYQALLHCTKNSLNAMKERVCGKRIRGTSVTSQQSPFFEVTVHLETWSEGVQVKISPSIEDVQEHINRAAIAVLKCSKSVINWFQQDKPDDEEKESFYDMIAQDKEIVKVILLLTGSIHGTKNTVTVYLDNFKKYNWLWEKKAEKSLIEFTKKDPGLDEFEEELKKFSLIEQNIDRIEEVFQIGAMALRTQTIKEGLKEYVHNWKAVFAKDLHKRAKARLDAIFDYINLTHSKLNKKAGGIENLHEVMLNMKEVRQKEGEIELEIKPIMDMYNILDTHLATGMEKDEQDHRHILKSKWKSLVEKANQRQNELQETQNIYKKELIVSVRSLIVSVADFRKDYDKSGPMVIGISPKDAQERLRSFKEKYGIQERTRNTNYAGEVLFNLPHQKYVDLDLIKKELELLDMLYNLYDKVNQDVAKWKEMAWSDAVEKMNEMTDQVENFANQCKKLPKQLKEWEAYKELKTQIDSFSEVLPILKDLSKPSIKQRHWDEISNLAKLDGKDRFSITSDEVFYLSKLIEINLLNWKEDVEEIIESADKQLKIEDQLTEIKAKWDNEIFDFDTYRNREYFCRLGAKVTEIQEGLDDAQAALTTMNAMKHVTPFKAEVMTYLNNFSEVSEIIDSWQKVQIMWQSLEPVFMGGDISRNMPTEARLFQNTDKMWVKIMEKAVETQKVIPCCQNEMLKQLLPSLKEKLETCQKSLDNYLESKRNKFARFFFVSDSVLLSILSQGSEPTSIQPFLENLYDAITKVQFDTKDRKLIIAMMSSIGKSEEKIELTEPVKAEGNIEDWLKKLEEEMRRTIKDILRNASRDCMSNDFKGFIEKYCAQASLTGLQLCWTYHVNECLEKAKDRKVAESKKEKMTQIWEVIRDMCLGELPNDMIRMKVTTLVTVHVYQRDILDDLVSGLGKDASTKGNAQNNFEWLKRTRQYWRNDNLNISITDQDFEYQYEYLGTKERLCITPLTDRCYVTLAQALGMNYGGSPAGPAGTGKTETVKDMGRTIGEFVVVTNCSDQHRYKDMAKIFKGLCQSGLWGCFDEFNRIKLEVLSVVAMQVAAITKAKKMKEKTCQFPGEVLQVTMIPTTAYFITMNPGYAGRQELPENMKVLFRGVAMMVPNRRVIIRVKLAAQGYDQYDPLSKKFTILYALCEEQLSKQRHYDFGLRNINSVLRSAGNIKREAPKGTEEEMLLMRTLRDMNLSKLVADDEPLFLQLLNDIFPSKGKVQKVTYGAIEKGLNKALVEEELIDEAKWVLKIIQVYETSLVRHGFMLVGPTASGKSTIIKVLVKVLSENVVQHKVQKINPKAMTAEELYGRKIELTDEWIPGVFSKLWQKFNNRNNKYNTWILCDGPVDTLWIESLNSVLDDSKILTLANNDRISMTDNVKLVFEVENLKNASPATVSRCGIVFLSEPDLGWTPLVESWIKRRISSQKAPVTGRSEEAAATKRMFEKYLNEKGTNVMVHLTKVLKFVPVMQFNVALQILNLLTLLTAMLNEYSDGDLNAVEFERLFLYCLAWSIGGLIDQSNRRAFHEYLASLGAPLPQVTEGETLYEYGFDTNVKNWVKWQPVQWAGKATGSFASLLIPTLDSTRAEYLISRIFTIKNNDEFNSKQVLIVGAPGTAKTSTILMYTQYKLPDNTIMKKLNFSSATQPKMFQDIIDDSLEKGVGRNFYPPGKKTMLVFIDDISMPFVNTWGDQVTLEIVRQLIEERGYYFLEKDKIGDFKKIENLVFIAAMGHPTGGRNDIPNRLKRQFFTFNMILPSKESIDNIYLVIINVTFGKSFTDAVTKTASMLTRSTLELWEKVQYRFKPTPSQFHYLFNMRELSRVFQGIIECVKTKEGKEVIKYAKNIGTLKPEVFLVGLWKHECERVFEDKLTTKDNKEEFKNFLRDVTENVFGSEFEDQLTEGLLFCDFQRKDKLNEEGEIEEEAPKVYEAIKSIPVIKKRIEKFLENYNADSKGKTMNLVLFDDAIRHLLRISRVIQMDRGNMLLVGVGGSGKQSLTRLAAYIGKHICYQITLTKTYNQRALFEDLLQLYKWSGHEGKKTTFILTDSEIKQEYFLEFFNSFLSTGEVAGLIQKEEKDIILADMRDLYAKEKPNVEPDNLALNNFFIDRVRNNLHLVLSFSPVGDKFRERFRKFPAIFNGCTINWFLPWPKEALISVSKSFIEDFPVHCTPEVKENLTSHMGRVHNLVNDVCSLYYNKMRRHVYVTPKSYLSFISSYKTVYKTKVTELEDQEKRVALGLKKLKGAEEDVKEMQIKLEQEKQKINEAEQKTEIMLKKLKVEKSKAEKQSEDVSARKTQCEIQAEKIRIDQQEADRDLQAALPYLQSALDAVDKITGPDINEIKTAKKPADIIKLIFDGVLILFQLQINGTNYRTHGMRKLTFEFLNDSFDDCGKPMINDPKFLAKLILFSREEKDKINDETCELLSPYLELEHFTAQNAKAASNAAEGLCIWVRAMVDYHEASKIVKPKMDFLTKQNQKLEAAMSELSGAEAELKAAQDILAKLEADFSEENNKKKVLEENMNKLKRKTDQANKLIVGLTDEKARWTEDSKNFADLKRRLIGDVAVSTAFMSYCGAFNSEFRNMLMKDYFIQDLTSSAIPVTLSLDLTSFLVEKTTVSEWNLQGLPKDDLSTQNGIMVTRASRFPLMIDPQGQAHRWILAKEKENLKITGMSGKFMEHVRFCLENGISILIENIENEVDPELDPVLEKQTIQKGRNKVVMVSGQSTEWTDSFKLFMTSRLGNPHFSPELAAKTTIIDFTVTIGGLEQQLLGRVLSKEQRSLEESLQQLLEEITANAKSLEQYNKNLLERLSKTEGNLIDDTELIEVLNSTKAKAKEVQQKLFEAKEKQEDIGEKREIYRPVATRGSLLYFGIVEMSLVNWMYNTSLTQFLQKFDESIELAEKAATPQERVKNITMKLTYIVYRYINRGLFEKDKLTFLLMICLKILLIGGKITQADADLLLKSGRGLDKNSIPPPKLDLDVEVWKNVIALSKHYYGKEHLCIFGDLPSDMDEKKNEWKAWLESTNPEKIPVPKYQEAINTEREIGKFIHFTLVRGLKEDRTIVCAIDFIENLLGKDFVSPVTDSMEEIWSESTNRVPVLFLLSAGADPTSAIEEQAKRKKKTKIGRVSMGEGQEVYAKEEMKAAFANGGWVILYNCHLGLEFMAQMETLLGRDVEIDPDFRLWLTCEPRESFPIGLLQMAIKVTNEPPKGLKAGMARTFSTIIDNDFLEKHDMAKWRYLVFILCFLHSVVIERRKFGALGWCIPYEFNNSDLEASLTFIDRHIYQAETVNQEPNPEIIKYMVCDVQYGGRITDEKDFELMQAFGNVWLENAMMKENAQLIGGADKDKDNAEYKVFDSTDVQRYRDYIHNLPNFEKPSLFYLNNNAEVQFRRREGNDLLNTIQMTQPKDSDTGTGKTRDDVVFEYVVDTLQKLPPDYVELDVRDMIKKLPGPPKMTDKGFNVPLNIFLFQEIMRLQNILGIVRRTLEDLKLVRAGAIILTPELQDAADAIYDSRVPKQWLYDANGSEISWLEFTLGNWMQGLYDRNTQLSIWLKERPINFNLGYFFNPQGFLTASKQEITRVNQANPVNPGEVWSLDDVEENTMVRDKPDKGVGNERGVIIKGLYLDGAKLNNAKGANNSGMEFRLEDLTPKDSVYEIPCIFVGAKLRDKNVKADADFSNYVCPVYKYRQRTDKYFIFNVKLKAGDGASGGSGSASSWKLKGVAVLCQKPV